MEKRTIQEIESLSSMWWPEDIKDVASKKVDLPRLLASQSEFLGILLLSKKEPLKVFDLINASEFPANLFLKHLAILTDFGGEPIKRLGKSFTNIFPENDKGHYFDFTWSGKSHRYQFQELPIKGLSNTKLSIDGVGQKRNTQLNGITKDMIAILLYAGSSNVRHLAGLEVCDIGTLIGHENKLAEYVKKKYILVSRITGGAIANSLGQALQTKIVECLKSELGSRFLIKSNGKIILDGYKKPTGMPFDVVVETNEHNAKIGIEISFQVTTNSTIERKSGQATNRQKLMHKNGHKIAYIIDGAGNFERQDAIGTIIENSDCTIAYSPNELTKLANWIREIL